MDDANDVRSSDRADRRRGSRAWRTLGFIAIVTVTALVGAWLPAGATETGGSAENGSPAPIRPVTSVRGWSVNLRTADGQRVPVVALADGRKVPQFVVGSAYRVSATVPPQVRAKTRTRSFALQHRAGADGEWTTVKLLTMSRSGRLTDTFTVGPEMIKLRDYRLVAATGPDAGYRLTSAAVGRDAAVPAQATADTTPTTGAPAPTTTTTTTTTTTAPTTTTTAGTATSTTVPATPSTTVPPNSLPAPPASDTFSAVANVQFAIQIANNSSNNLNLYLPSTQSNGTYQEVEVSLANGETKTLFFNNPPPGAAFHLRVNKQKCFAGCTNYIVNWAAPQGWKNWPSPCSAANTMPTFLSGQTYKVDLTNQTGAINVLSAGTLTGELGGPGSGSSSCTFQLENAKDVAVDNWLQNNPVKGFLYATAAIAVVAVVVAVAVVTMGTAAPEEAAVLAEVTDEAGAAVAELAADDTVSVTAVEGSFENGSFVEPDGTVNQAFIQPSVEVSEGPAAVENRTILTLQRLFVY